MKTLKMKRRVDGLSGQYFSCMFVGLLLNNLTQLRTTYLFINHKLWSITLSVKIRLV